jgi:hypothetical protein
MDLTTGFNMYRITNRLGLGLGLDPNHTHKPTHNPIHNRNSIASKKSYSDRQAILHMSSSLTTIMDNRNSNSNKNPKKIKLKAPSIFINTVGIFIVGFFLKAFTRQWIAVKAGEKFLLAGGWKGIYATIPIFSG